MYETVTFDGGVLSESIDGGRASASIELSATGIVARTSTNQTFSIRYRDVVLDMGGASGRMVFCRTADRSVTIFCEDHRFPATLELESGNEISEQLTTLRKSRRTEEARWRMGLLTLLVSSILLLVGSYYGLIWLARASLMAVPVAVDEKIGNMAFEAIDLDGPRVNDKIVVDAIKEIVDRLEPHSELRGLKFDVRVVDSPEMNAFCLPGGKLIVNTGLLKKVKTPEQVAGVLSHEMAHAIKRHGLQRISQSVGLIAAVQFLIGDVGGLMALGVELGKSAALTSYSREHETEADLVGTRMLHAAQIDPRELAAFFEILKEEGNDVPDAIRWLSTHPQHDERIAAIRGEVAKLPPQEWKPLETNWNEVQERLKQLNEK